MSLTISAELLAKTTCEPLAYERKRGLSWNERECYVNVGQLSDADLEDIKKRGGTGPVNNPNKMAQYAVDRIREQSRIISATSVRSGKVNCA